MPTDVLENSAEEETTTTTGVASLPPVVRKELPREFARTKQAVILEVTPTGTHVVGMVNPRASLDYDAIISTLNLPRRLVRKQEITHDEFETLFREQYRSSEGAEALEDWASLGGKVEDKIPEIAWADENNEEAVEIVPGTGEGARVLDRILLILQQAAKLNASDVYLTHEGKTGTIKVKIDNRISPHVIRLSREKYESMVNTILSRARLTPDDMEREFGNSKIHISINGRITEYRLSNIPSELGKSLCLRLNVNVITNLDKLGFFPSQQQRIKRGLEKTEGMVVIAGPTGGGKSNTMESMLFQVDDGSIVICQAGNPIEFVVPGRIQVSINKKERTWTQTIEQFMRHAPNVISPGEIKTPEEAGIALQGASTGHLLMTTLHATSAAKSISRLRMLQIDPFELAEHTKMVIAQRLPALLCQHCRIPDENNQGEYLTYDRAHAEAYNLRPNTCPQCLGRGTIGRTAIGEVLLVTPRIKELIMSNASSDEIETVARQEGMMTMAEAGEIKVRQGLTSRKEIDRVLGQLVYDDPIENEYTQYAQPLAA